MTRRLLLLILAASSFAFGQTDWHVTVTDNLPTAPPYSDQATGAFAGNGAASHTDTLIVNQVYSDSVKAKQGKSAVPADSLSHSDTVAYTHGLNLPAEQLGESDQPSTTHGVFGGGGVGNSRLEADSLSVALTYGDVVSTAKNAGGSANSIFPSTTLAFTDVVNRGLAVKPADSFLVTSSVCANAAFSGLRENLAEGDHVQVNAFTGATANSRSLFEPLTESDQPTRQIAISIFPLESLIYIDSAGYQGINPVPVADSLSVSDAVSVPRSASPTQTLVTTDSTFSVAAHFVKLTDSSVYTDGIFVSPANSQTRRGLLISRNQGPLP